MCLHEGLQQQGTVAYAAVVRQAPAPPALPLAHAGQSPIPQVAHLASQVPARALHKNFAQALHAQKVVLIVRMLSIGNTSSAVCDCALAHYQMVRSDVAALHTLAVVIPTIRHCLQRACAAERAPEDAIEHGHQQAEAQAGVDLQLGALLCHG